GDRKQFHFHIFELDSFGISSLKNLLRIFPEGDFGISLTNLTPPVICLYVDTFTATKLMTSFSVILSLARTTYARINSPTFLSGIPITAASLTIGCESSRS
ncbi:hypothetical protein PMAYCL1PPCAC_16264, partial [Pristionchus mayeri]